MLTLPDQRITVPERCPRCGGWRDVRRPAARPHWRGGSRARIAGDAAQVGQTDGAARIKDDGWVVAGNADPCCCTQSTNTCAACNLCCFSNQSLADISYSMTTVLVSSGDGAVAWRTQSRTNAPFFGAVAGSTLNWGNPNQFNELNTGMWCVGGGGFNAGDWRVWTRTNSSGTAPTDFYVVEINSGGIQSPLPGTCCGATTLNISMRVTHYAAGLLPTGQLGQAVGTGRVTITIKNNNCCRDSQGHCQAQAATNCAGACLASP